MTGAPEPWGDLERGGRDRVVVGGVPVAAGSRVRLHPRGNADIIDLALDGRSAVVQAIEEDVDGSLQVAVTLDDDPGRELGEARFPGHRFFFSVDEVEPLDPAAPDAPPARRVLVAGIGNVFLADDGFGVEAATRLSRRPLPQGVDVVDFGIRGMDLAYALQRGYEAAILLDATPRGLEPGTVSVIEVDPDEADPSLDTHGMDPLRVLGLARALGTLPPRLVVVGCEPLVRMTGAEPDVAVALSAPVAAAVDEAVAATEALVAEITAVQPREEPS